MSHSAYAVLSSHAYPIPCFAVECDWLSVAPADAPPPQAEVWDMLWRGESPGRIALAVCPNEARIEQLKAQYRLALPVDVPLPEGATDNWQQDCRNQLYRLAAQMQLPGDYCPALSVPRWVHGQSQGMIDLFGAQAEQQSDGNIYPHPLPPDPDALLALIPGAIDTSRYWGAVRWMHYARATTGGAFPFQNAVMVGPLDLVNYLLGSTVLMEWLYTEPETVHHLLDGATEVIIAMMTAMREAAGGAVCPHHIRTMRGGFDLCSEVRSIISPAMYEAFDAPYLQRIGRRFGPIGLHSCGNWEHTVPSVLRDPAIRVMNGQSKENDIAALCRLAGGRFALSIAQSANLHERYLWPDLAAFLRHVLAVVPDTQPFELTIGEDDLPLFLALHREIRGTDFPLPPPLWEQ